MESNKILGADILDILFEGRNKEYGAYDLRKTYNMRLGRAMAVMGSVVLLLFLSGFVTRHKSKISFKPEDPDVHLVDITPKIDPPPPVIPPKPQVPQARTLPFTVPKIAPNDEVKEAPPEQTTLDSVRIGTMKSDGPGDVDIVAPPNPDAARGVVVEPKKADDDGGGFMKIEKESEYPGGLGAWQRYLGKNLRTPDDALNNEISGTVLVKFMVDADGNVSNVEAVAGPTEGGLRDEAVRVIKKSGKWTPALQNGRYVKSYKQQPITFIVTQQ
jgi:protein TonB